jgi:hypothetical protein
MAAFTSGTGVFPYGFAATRRLPSSLSRSRNLSSRRSGGKPSTASAIASLEPRSVSRIRWSAGLAALGRLELNEGGAGGRRYVERLAATLTVHLLRSSGLSRRSPIPHKGGLAPRQIRRVLDYIEARQARHCERSIFLSNAAAPLSRTR